MVYPPLEQVIFTVKSFSGAQPDTARRWRFLWPSIEDVEKCLLLNELAFYSDINCTAQIEVTADSEP